MTLRSAAPPTSDSLWHNRDFMRLWGGETLSQIGSQISLLALPLTAILTLHAGPQAVGLLATAQFAPILLISLFAGAWLDSHRRRPVLIAANFGRAALMGLIPVLFALDLLTLYVLFGIAFATGVLTALFDIAYVSYLPQLVSRRKLTEANARLESTYSIAEIGGPGLGGLLVQIFTAPVAILADVATYLTAGVLSIRIRNTEPPPVRAEGAASSPWPAIKAGLVTTLRHPVLRPIVLQSACFNLFAPVVFTLFLLYGVRDLHLSPGELGLILATGSVGGLVGSIIARRLAQRIGTGRAAVWSMMLGSVSLAAIPAAAGQGITIVLLLVSGLLLHGVGLAVFNVHSLSLRAALIPSRMLGRATATYRFISNGTLPLSGMLAALLGWAVGARAAMAIGVALLTICCVAFALSRIRRFEIDRTDSVETSGEHTAQATEEAPVETHGDAAR